MSDTHDDVPVVNAGTIPVRPSKYQESLQDSFAKDVANQAGRMEDLAKILINLNLAIPALYGAVLKLTQDETSTISGVLILIAFTSWLVALGLAFLVLLPVKTKVNPNSIPALETYFATQALRKQKLVMSASLTTFFGICLVIFGLVL
ncbi:hypothetical protein [Thiofilum flexile]|uniref:hypothetical protein n=1 Tax=Thiofilum flexile TaxID=125627 RepID=UPI000376D08B|nr:hypothetical protein [Thiofilum flexile]